MWDPGFIIKLRAAQTTERCRAMQVRSTSSIGFAHQASEKISISE